MRPALANLVTLCILVSHLGSLVSPALSRGGTGGGNGLDKRPGVRKRALLVAISQYPQLGPRPWKPLTAHRDVVELAQALQEHGFQSDDILTLEDASATAEGIRAAFRQHLIEPARPGDVVVFHFSGHGQQLLDDNGDEVDGLDESLVPFEAVDQRASAGARTNIRDDELAQWLRGLQGKMRAANGQVQGSITVSLDSCFAGTATRGELGERGRGWDLDLDGPLPPSRGARGVESASSLREAAGDYILLSAARSDETAKERDGMGVFSRGLVQGLHRAAHDTTYRSLLEDIVLEVARSGVRSQNPELEGDDTRLLFSGAARRRVPTVPVRTVQGEVLTIPVGEVHLATVGSLYALHRAGAQDLGATTLIGEAEVIQVGPFSSTLRLRPGASLPAEPRAAYDLLLRARVVEIAHRYADPPLRVLLSGAGPELAAKLAGFPILHLGAVPRGEHDVEIRVRGGVLELLRPESAVPLARITEGPCVVDRLTPFLSAERRLRSLMMLRSGDEALKVQMRFLTTATEPGPGRTVPSAARTLIPRTSPLQMKEGDTFRVELTNHSAQDLWVNVLELGANGDICPIFPHPRAPGDGKVPAARSVVLPAPLYEFRVTPPFGRSMFKVIATPHQVSFAPLLAAGCPALQRREKTRASLLPSPDDPSHLRVSDPLNPLAQWLTDVASGERGATPPVRSQQLWGLTTELLDQVPRQRGPASADRPAASVIPGSCP